VIFLLLALLFSKINFVQKMRASHRFFVKKQRLLQRISRITQITKINRCNPRHPLLFGSGSPELGDQKIQLNKKR